MKKLCLCLNGDLPSIINDVNDWALSLSHIPSVTTEESKLCSCQLPECTSKSGGWDTGWNWVVGFNWFAVLWIFWFWLLFNSRWVDTSGMVERPGFEFRETERFYSNFRTGSYVRMTKVNWKNIYPYKNISQITLEGLGGWNSGKMST